jgi:branched-chain amino acid transport system ATP-binding protein
VLRLRNVEAGYGPITVLRRVTLHVGQGEVVTILGANGAGKTTLLRTVVGLVPARRGELLFRGQPIGGARTERIAAAGCALVPEGRQVFAAMPVRENLLLGATLPLRRGLRRQVDEDLERMAGLFPVLAARGQQLAGTLSGGEQQMLAIARALMSRPALLMLDEPSMGLAPRVVKEIFATIRCVAEAGTTVLLVEQNARAALQVADYGYVLETGELAVEGPSHELAANPRVAATYLGKGATG